MMGRAAAACCMDGKGGRGGTQILRHAAQVLAAMWRVAACGVLHVYAAQRGPGCPAVGHPIPVMTHVTPGEGGSAPWHTDLRLRDGLYVKRQPLRRCAARGNSHGNWTYQTLAKPWLRCGQGELEVGLSPDAAPEHADEGARGLGAIESRRGR